MAVANLKNLLGAGGSSIVLKAAQSYEVRYGIGGVETPFLDVSSPTNIVSLTGRWALVFLRFTCNASGAGTMTGTLNVDGVNVLQSAPIGTTGGSICGMQIDQSGIITGQSPIIICNNSLTFTIQRSTADTVRVSYCALAIE